VLVQATRFNEETRQREPVPEFNGECPVAYHIGLSGLECIEIQRTESGYVFLYWQSPGVLLRSRPLSQREIDYLEHANTHVDNYFRILAAALGVSELLFSRARFDAGLLASAIRGIVGVHDAHLRAMRIFIPMMPSDPFIEMLRLLVDRVEDIVEMSAIGEALALQNKQTLPSPQGKARD
jgi:hypothetical protein